MHGTCLYMQAGGFRVHGGLPLLPTWLDSLGSIHPPGLKRIFKWLGLKHIQNRFATTSSSHPNGLSSSLGGPRVVRRFLAHPDSGGVMDSRSTILERQVIWRSEKHAQHRPQTAVAKQLRRQEFAVVRWVARGAPSPCLQRKQHDHSRTTERPEEGMRRTTKDKEENNTNTPRGQKKDKL